MSSYFPKQPFQQCATYFAFYASFGGRNARLSSELLLSTVMPSARLSEKLRPGM